MGGHGDKHGAAHADAVCPVCGAKMRVEDGTPRASHAGTLYFLDTEDHLRAFVAEPSRYLKSSAKHEHPGGTP